MKATDELKHEHGPIAAMVRIMELAANRIRGGWTMPPEDLQSIVEFLQVFVDKCHHAKEERLFFPSLEEVGISSEAGIIGGLIAEHETGRQHTESLASSLKRYKKGTADAPSEIVQTMADYSRLMFQHISKENNTLFPLADARLPLEEQEKLAYEFASLEEQEIGLEKMEALRESLERLKNAYMHRL